MLSKSKGLPLKLYFIFLEYMILKRSKYCQSYVQKNEDCLIRKKESHVINSVLYGVDLHDRKKVLSEETDLFLVAH